MALYMAFHVHLIVLGNMSDSCGSFVTEATPFLYPKLVYWIRSVNGVLCSTFV